MEAGESDEKELDSDDGNFIKNHSGGIEKHWTMKTYGVVCCELELILQVGCRGCG